MIKVKINDLPKDLRHLALKRREEELKGNDSYNQITWNKNKSDVKYLLYAFNWRNTSEGADFWNDIDNQYNHKLNYGG